MIEIKAFIHRSRAASVVRALRKGVSLPKTKF